MALASERVTCPCPTISPNVLGRHFLESASYAMIPPAGDSCPAPSLSTRSARLCAPCAPGHRGGKRLRRLGGGGALPMRSVASGLNFALPCGGPPAARGVAGTRIVRLPLLPSGPDGICRLPLRRARRPGGPRRGRPQLLRSG